LLSILLFPFWLIHALVHGSRHRESSYLRQRLGIQRGSEQESIWIHASSVGEVSLIEPLATALAETTPVTVTTFTASGYQHARRILPRPILVRVLPIDCWLLARRFFKTHRLRLALIAETELWPELLYRAKSRNIPLLQINARVGEKTLHASGWLQPILRRSLSYFDRFLTRNKTDGLRLQKLGIEADRITLCGNLKLAAEPASEDYPRLIDAPYLLFASTHAPEELEFVRIMQQLNFPRLCVLAPRHPGRGDDIEREITNLKLPLARRSRGQPLDADTRVYLADTLGELRALMQHAEVVVMGGSFNNTGGHNVLEAVGLGRAVITGPSDSNIVDDIQQLLGSTAIIQVANLHELEQTLALLLNDPGARQQLEQHAQQAATQWADVLATYLEQINAYA
jgi:3-deoxy-D-manno-octulosonic-acid transferase